MGERSLPTFGLLERLISNVEDDGDEMQMRAWHESETSTRSYIFPTMLSKNIALERRSRRNQKFRTVVEIPKPVLCFLFYCSQIKLNSNPTCLWYSS